MQKRNTEKYSLFECTFLHKNEGGFDADSGKLPEI